MGRILRALQKARAQRESESQGAPVAAATVTLGVPARAAAVKPEPVATVAGLHGTPDEYLVVLHAPDSAQAAQFRQLRVKLLATEPLAGMVKESKRSARRPMHAAIVVTSGTRDEGKTTVACNLAAAFAEDTSSRVLVIDANLDSPDAYRMLAIDESRAERGIGDVLSNGLTLNGAIYETAIPNLHVLPALPVGAERRLQGAETVFDAKTSDLLQLLYDVQQYNYIFIDTPSHMASNHATIIGQHADGVLMVARAERTKRQLILRSIQEMQECHVRVLGVVMTYLPHHIPDFIYSFMGTTSGQYREGAEEAPAFEAGYGEMEVSPATKPLLKAKQQEAQAEEEEEEEEEPK